MALSCKECRYAWTGDDGSVHCGGSPDWDNPPPWASRKYSLIGLLAMAKGITENMDCENVNPSDAEFCNSYDLRK